MNEKEPSKDSADLFLLLLLLLMMMIVVVVVVAADVVSACRADSLP